MRVVLDTNILVPALIVPTGKPAAIYNAWVEGKFTLLTCAAHLEELCSTLLKARVAELIKPYKAGRLVNQIKRLAQDVDPLPPVERSPDPTDDFLLQISRDGRQERTARPRPPQGHADCFSDGFLGITRMNSPALEDDFRTFLRRPAKPAFASSIWH